MDGMCVIDDTQEGHLKTMLVQYSGQSLCLTEETYITNLMAKMTRIQSHQISIPHPNAAKSTASTTKSKTFHSNK